MNEDTLNASPLSTFSTPNCTSVAKENGGGGKLTLSTLISNGIIEPGSDVMTIEYLGKSFAANLTPDGLIECKTFDRTFTNPSAWAIHCKASLNPSKRSGCGWASVKYRGQKMDKFKAIWTKQKTGGVVGPDCMSSKPGRKSKKAQQPVSQSSSMTENGLNLRPLKSLFDLSHTPALVTNPPENVFTVQEILSDNKEGCSIRTQVSEKGSRDVFILPELLNDDSVDCLFTSSVSSSVWLILELHRKLTSDFSLKDNFKGYLGGKWNSEKSHLAITHAFPLFVNNVSQSNKLKEKISSLNLQFIGMYKGVVLDDLQINSSLCLPSLVDIKELTDSQVESISLDNEVGWIPPYISLLYANVSKYTFLTAIPLKSQQTDELIEAIPIQFFVQSTVEDLCLSLSVLNEINLLVVNYGIHSVADDHYCRDMATLNFDKWIRAKDVLLHLPKDRKGETATATATVHESGTGSISVDNADLFCDHLKNLYSETLNKLSIIKN